MDRALMIRIGGLYLPVMVAAWLWYWRRPSRAGQAGLLLATLWNFAALAGFAALAPTLGWWSFHATGAIFLGIPVDLLLGWAVLWGVVPLLACPRWPPAPVLAIFLALDLALMPRLSPILQLGPRWLIGEGAALALALAPSLCLGRWTRDGSHLYGRASLQVALFSGLTLGLLPATILARTGGSWHHALSRPFWLNSLFLQLLAPVAVIGLSAVHEFATRGGGTPLPYDPPRKLVTSGIYRYLANPMQFSAMVLLAGWGWFLGSWWVAAAGVMAHLYSVGLAAWDEEEDVSTRFGLSWSEYRAHVRTWIPRWRPWDGWSHGSAFGSASSRTRARLYVAETCGPCSEVKRWFEKRRALGLEIVAAEDYPGVPLERVTYEAGDYRAQGLAALARGLEHIHFGWALVGCAVRLPGALQLLQWVADASGAGPRIVTPRITATQP